MQEQANTNRSEHRSELWSLSLRDLFYKYVRFLPVFLFSVAFCLFVAYAYLRYATRIYSAGGSMLIKSEQSGARGDKFEDLFVNNKAQNIASEIEVLRSVPLMERVVRQLELQSSYVAVGKFISTNIYNQGPFIMEVLALTDSSLAFSLNIKPINEEVFRINNESDLRFGDAFKNQHGMFKLVRNPGTRVGKEYNILWRPAVSVAGGLAGGIQVTPKAAGTGILNVTLQGTNPKMCADVVNQLMMEYTKYSIELKNQTSDNIIRFIDTQLVRYGDQLDSVQGELLAYQQKNGIVNIESQSSDYFNKIREADMSTLATQLKLNYAEMIDKYMVDKRNEFERMVVPSTLGIEDVTLNELVSQYNAAQLERKMLIDASVSKSHPAVKQVDGQVEKLRQSIQENLGNIKSSYNVAIGQMRQKANSANAQLRDMPFKEKEYFAIKRQVETMQTLYGYLREKKEETSISRASTIPNSQVINMAGLSSVPIKPNKRAVRIFAILLGLGLPAVFIFIAEVLNDKIMTRFDIEKISPVPILGEVGHSYSANALVVNKTTRKMVAEQFRIIRSNLQYILAKIDRSVIMVTSSFSGEGKSFVTMNLGAVLALAGKKTIVLEFDIRKPKILSILGMSKRPGITNFLVGKGNLEDLIIQVPDQDNLYVMACGPVPPNPSELLLDTRVEELFKWLRENFDVILVDTAPVGMVSDAQSLGKFADCTLYLVRQGHTFKKQVALIDEFYQENKLPKVAIIINDVKMKAGYGYYGYGRYGYGYGYGYGGYYEEETPPRTYFEKVFSWFDVRRLFGKPKRRK